MHNRRRRPGVATALVALGVSLIISISGCGDLSRDELNRGVDFDEILLGRRALLRRLRGPAQRCRGIPWEAIVEVSSEQIVVRA